jgi:hypothetical protein
LIAQISRIEELCLDLHYQSGLAKDSNLDATISILMQKQDKKKTLEIHSHSFEKVKEDDKEYYY